MLELLTPQAMARADRLTIDAGTPGIVLMERAGRAVADAAAFRHPLGSRVLILCGPGNNGGDGFIAARVLRERGYRVEVQLFGTPEALRGDAAEAARRCGGSIVILPDEPFAAGRSVTAAADRATVIIDALYGAGLGRDLEGAAAAVVRAVNASGKPVVAVDLPSGIDGATGAVRGVAIEASASVTFFRRKPGHLLLPGRRHCGTVILADIGIQPQVLDEIGRDLSANGPALWGYDLHRPGLEDHKFTRGHALVLSGPMLATGAARLAAMAALRAGAGLVTLASPSEALAVNAAHLTAIMLKQVDSPADFARLLEDPRLNSCVIGPAAGIGPETAELVRAALGMRAGTGKAPQRGFVLDADALTAFAEAPGRLFEAIAGHFGPVVLTPHEGEFRRLFPDLGPVDARGANVPKTERARQAARRSGATVILKGADTVIAAPDGRVAINDNAPPDLGTAGSGDVLAGLIGGLLARGMPGFSAATAGVWMHGDCGRRAGAGLIAEDLPGQIPAVLADLYAWQSRPPQPDGSPHPDDEDPDIGGSD